jgi:hypothetical protein
VNFLTLAEAKSPNLQQPSRRFFTNILGGGRNPRSQTSSESELSQLSQLAVKTPYVPFFSPFSPFPRLS